MSCTHPEFVEGRCRDCGLEIFGDWVLDAADLLAEGDPGPTPMLVEDLIVDRALVAAVGRWKTTKSYGMLSMCISIATGEPAFGALAIAEPGRVVFVNEESGKAALWRRLDALCRGRAIEPELLRNRLLVAPNARVKLDDPDWQGRLLEFGLLVQPRLFVFDPLARMKAPSRDESAQNEMAGVIEFLRLLRDETNAAVAFVHHTGHQGDHMRGSSDLESAWETRLHWKRDGRSSEVSIEADHREVDTPAKFTYRIAWDGETRSMRLEAVADDVVEAAREYLAKHPAASANEVFEVIGGKRATVLEAVKSLRQEVVPDDGYHPGTTGTESRAGSGTPGPPFREAGYHPDDLPSQVVPGGGYHSRNSSPPILGDPGFLEHLDAALANQLITEAEYRQAERGHSFVVGREAPAA